MTIVEYSSEDNTATLLLSLVSEVETKDTKVKVRAGILNKAERIDGKWLLRPETLTMFSEQL